MDCWNDVKTPDQHLERSLEVLQKFYPWEYERSRNAKLTDPNGILAERFPPTASRSGAPPGRRWKSVRGICRSPAFPRAITSASKAVSATAKSEGLVPHRIQTIRKSRDCD